MDIETEKNRLASLRQDFAVLRETLGASCVRRVNSDLIDVGIVFLIALSLRDSPISPWFSMAYFLVRDLPPLGRGFGKILTGIRVYSADSLTPATPKQLVIRGFSNLFIVLPFGFLLMSFFAYVILAVISSGFIFFMWGRDSIFLKAIGFDFPTGQTLADRLAGTHLIEPRDVESLGSMATKIENLQRTIDTDDHNRTIRG